jgi:hypothetical protein
VYVCNVRLWHTHALTHGDTHPPTHLHRSECGQVVNAPDRTRRDKCAHRATALHASGDPPPCPHVNQWHTRHCARSIYRWPRSVITAQQINYCDCDEVLTSISIELGWVGRWVGINPIHLT